jgi:hypothetical protein
MGVDFALGGGKAGACAWASLAGGGGSVAGEFCAGAP